MSKIEWTREELLADAPVDEPLIAGGVRCHGGFADGALRVAADAEPGAGDRGLASAAARRRPARWSTCRAASCRRTIRTTRRRSCCCRKACASRVTRSLTMISIVEGFGAIIRDLPVPDFARDVVGDLGGTALAHLGTGLFEAHARDEAG